MTFPEFMASLAFRDWVLFAAFALSVGNLLWILYRDVLRERARLRVTVKEAFVSESNPDENDPARIIIISAVNVGRRTVTVENWLYKRKGEKFYCWLMPNWDHPLSPGFDKVPKELKEGQKFQTFISTDSWDDYSRRSSIKWFAITDTLNRSWKSKRYPLPQQSEDN